MNTMAIIFQLVSRCYSLYIPDIEESGEASRVTLIAAAKHTLIRLRKYLAEVSLSKNKIKLMMVSDSISS